MIGAHQNLNGLCSMTTPLRLALATISLPIKSEVSLCAPYEHMKRNTECGKLGCLGYLAGH